MQNIFHRTTGLQNDECWWGEESSRSWSFFFCCLPIDWKQFRVLLKIGSDWDDAGTFFFISLLRFFFCSSLVPSFHRLDVIYKTKKEAHEPNHQLSRYWITGAIHVESRRRGARRLPRSEGSDPGKGLQLSPKGKLIEFIGNVVVNAAADVTTIDDGSILCDGGRQKRRPTPVHENGERKLRAQWIEQGKKRRPLWDIIIFDFYRGFPPKAPKSHLFIFGCFASIFAATAHWKQSISGAQGLVNSEIIHLSAIKRLEVYIQTAKQRG